MRTYLTRLTYKIIGYFDIITYFYGCFYMFITIFIVVIIF